MYVDLLPDEIAPDDGKARISCYVDECKQADMFLDLELGKISVEEFCDEIRRRAPGCEASNEEIRYAWGELLQQIPVRRMRAVERLHKTHKVYMLSNSNSVHWDKAVEHFFPLSGHGPEYYFDKTFISYNMGMVKPDPRIFETLLQKTGAVAEETLFVDDSLANCKAAEAFAASPSPIIVTVQALLPPSVFSTVYIVATAIL